jgi:hypothetical protein
MKRVIHSDFVLRRRAMRLPMGPVPPVVCFLTAALWACMELDSVVVAQTAQQTHQPVASTTAGAMLYTIAGTVTNIVTGEPVSRATVSLLNEEDREVAQTGTTDADGHFALNPVAAGKYGLRVARRGFQASFFNEHDLYSSSIVTGEGQDTEHIAFQLNPGAMIYGAVMDDAGEPVQQAQVMLMRKSHNGGLGEHLEQSFAATTDDEGAFELWNLIPGTYFLTVKATPWFALHPTMRETGTALTPEQNTAAAALNVAYPVTYYEGTTDGAGATPITLASGDRVEANVALHAVPAVHLKVHVSETEAEGRKYVDMPMLQQSILGEEQSVTGVDMRPGPPGSGWVEIDGIAPGHYSMLQGNPQKITELDASGSGSQDVNATAGASTAKIDVRVRMADGSLVPQPLDLTLTSEPGTQRLLAAHLAGPDVRRFEAVPPGTWNLMARANNLVLSVVAVQTAAGTRPDSRITVRSRSLSLGVVLAQGTTRVQGFARKDGRGLAGVMIVLVPHDPAANWASFRRDQSDSDGSFVLRDVVPGQYTVVAIEDGWELDWARPEVIGRYLPHGLGVTVSSQSGKSVSLVEPVVVQAR